MKNNNNEPKMEVLSKKIVYSPKIKPEHVSRLYRLKQIENLPMTVLVSKALEEYLTKKETYYPQLKGYNNE